MNAKLIKKLDEYADRFGDIFPTMQVFTPDIERLVDTCLRVDKPLEKVQPFKKNVKY